MLIGLTAKNAILIVAFAKEHRDRGAGILEAATTAARLRLRPILMTAFAFIFGVLPLVLASGAGANSRHSMGTTIMGGMLVECDVRLLSVMCCVSSSCRISTANAIPRDRCTLSSKELYKANEACPAVGGTKCGTPFRQRLVC
jgi:hypothetical protein